MLKQKLYIRFEIKVMLDLEYRINATVQEMGFELVELILMPEHQIQVFVDKPSGGITADECGLVSKYLEKLLLAEGVDYKSLEVSSPGLERPIKKLEDYQKFTNRLAKISILLDGKQQKFKAKILGVELPKQEVILKTATNDSMRIAFVDIIRARLIYDM